jgi:hypothetical protein
MRSRTCRSGFLRPVIKWMAATLDGRVDLGGERSRRRRRPTCSSFWSAGRSYANCLRKRIGEPIPSGLSNGFGGFVASGLLAAYADHEEIDTDLIAINPGELATAVSQAAG